MANQVSSLREAINRITIEGYLEEKNLEIKTKDNKTFITGNLIIGISSEEKYKVKFYANQVNSSGFESKVFKALETVMREYVSRAEALEKNLSEEYVTKVLISGAKFSINDYYNAEKGVMYNTPEIRANFVNRVTENFNPHVSFDVETYFEKMEKETDEHGVETGRVRVDGIVPIYNGAVIPLTFYTTEDKTYGDIGKYLLEHYEAGKSAYIGGSIRCIAKTTSANVSGFGAPVERTFTEYTYENIIERGAENQYLITDPKNFDKATIKAAMLYRDEMLEQKKLAGNSVQSTGGFGNATATAKTKELDF